MCDYGPFQNVLSHTRRHTYTHTHKHTHTNRGAVSCFGALHSVSWVKQDAQERHIICNLTHVSCCYPVDLQCCCRTANVPEGNVMTICPQSFDLCDIQFLEKKMDEPLLISTEEYLQCSNLELQECLVQHFRRDKYSNSDEHHTYDSGLQAEVKKKRQLCSGRVLVGRQPKGSAMYCRTGLLKRYNRFLWGSKKKRDSIVLLREPLSFPASEQELGGMWLLPPTFWRSGSERVLHSSALISCRRGNKFCQAHRPAQWQSSADWQWAVWARSALSEWEAESPSVKSVWSAQ